MAAWPIACAKWLLPVPPGPRNNASSRLARNAHVARSKTRLRFIFGVKVKSKLSSVLCTSRNAACLRRRSSSRSLRRVSSSVTRQEIRSMGAIASAWAWRNRVSSTAAMPPSRSWRSARSSSMKFMVILLTSSAFDEIAIQSELADQRINLTQAERQLWVVFQVAAHEVVFARACFQSHGAGVIGGSNAALFGEREYTQDAAHRNLAMLSVHGLAQRADLRSCFFGTTTEFAATDPRPGSDSGRAVDVSVPAAVGW